MRRFDDIGGRILVAAFAALAIPSASSAAKSPGAAPSVQSVLDCRTIVDGPDRLACFDKAVAAMEQAASSGDLVTVDRDQRRIARHQAFGLVLPGLAFLDRGEKPEEADRMTEKVASASQDASGRWTIRLENGAVWRQIDDNTLYKPAHPGSAVEIRRGVLGSFTLKIDGQFPFKAHRES